MNERGKSDKEARGGGGKHLNFQAYDWLMCLSSSPVLTNEIGFLHSLHEPRNQRKTSQPFKISMSFQ